MLKGNEGDVVRDSSDTQETKTPLPILEGQRWGGPVPRGRANPAAERDGRAGPSSSGSTEGTASAHLIPLSPHTHTLSLLFPGVPLENITSNDMPPLVKFTNNSFRRDGGGARPEPFSRAQCGEMVVFVGKNMLVFVFPEPLVPGSRGRRTVG